MVRRRWRSIPTHRGVVILACLLPLGGCGADFVQLSNASSGEKGILVDGQEGSTFQNDKTQWSTNTRFLIGKFTGGPGEVVAFGGSRPVGISTPFNWTSGEDTVNLALSPRIVIPATVWIVQGPFVQQRDLAVDHWLTTSNIWVNERMGVSLSLFQIINATTDPDAAKFVDFDCSKRAAIQTDIGHVQNRINIYWVDTVDGGTGRGQACNIGSDFVAMGSATGTELLSHELGHDLALEHVDGQAGFDQTNVMHSASNTREFITEGQLFRAHLRPPSALNAVYAARPGLPTRDCGHAAASNDCPSVLKRIWADGTFPEN
jgi:hypothetical protein